MTSLAKMVLMVWRNSQKKLTTPGDEASPTLGGAMILTKEILPGRWQGATVALATMAF